MSEPDSSQRRRPPTIDLTAKEVETEPTGAAQDSAEADTGRRRPEAGGQSRGFAMPYAIGALAGAIAVGVVIAALLAAGLLSSRVTPVPLGVQAAKPAATDQISARLDKIEQALQAPRPDGAVAARMTQAEAQTKALNDGLAALTHRVDDLAAATQNALTQAKAAATDAAAATAKSASQASAQHGDIDALTKRMAALEGAVKSLGADLARRPSTADDKAARATLAAEALRVAVERGAPYEAELAAVKSLGADQSAVATLEPFAADGVPSAVTLGHELAALMPLLRRIAEAAPRNASLLGRLKASAQKLVRITPVDASTAAAPTGDDPSSVIGRIDADAARSDVTAALGDIARLPEAARAPAQTWVKKAEARAAAIAAGRRIAADALAGLSKPASQ